MDLILNTYGTCLTKDNDTFVVIHQDGKQRIHPDGLKSISISRGAQITSDAAIMAIEHEIEVLFVDKSGNPVGRLWSHRYGSVSTIRKGQLEFTFSKDAVKWICSTIIFKMENQQALLLSMNTTDSLTENNVKKQLTGLKITGKRFRHSMGRLFLISPLRCGDGRAPLHGRILNVLIFFFLKITG